MKRRGQKITLNGVNFFYEILGETEGGKALKKSLNGTGGILKGWNEMGWHRITT